MGISTPFIRRPIATSLLMAGIFLVGAAAYPFLPVAPLPQVDFPTIQVTTQLPGADPVTMASSVTAPLERQFAQIPGVTQMTSSSVLGVSSITVQFDLSRNIDAAAGDIQAAINAAGGQLPKNLPSPPQLPEGQSRRRARSWSSRSIRTPCRSRRLMTTPKISWCRTSARSRGWPRSILADSRSRRSASRSIPRSSPRWVSGWRICARHRERHDGQPEGQHRRRNTHLHDLRQRSIADRRALERRHRRLQERRARARSRHRPRGRWTGAHQIGGVVQRQARGHFGGHEASLAPT